VLRKNRVIYLNKGADNMIDMTGFRQDLTAISRMMIEAGDSL
jgi:hypothetical protein